MNFLTVKFIIVQYANKQKTLHTLGKRVARHATGKYLLLIVFRECLKNAKIQKKVEDDIDRPFAEKKMENREKS